MKERSRNDDCKSHSLRACCSRSAYSSEPASALAYSQHPNRFAETGSQKSPAYWRHKRLNLIIGLLMIVISGEAQRVFYVDHEKGNDLNNGTHAAAAWRSLEKVNSFPFTPGDQILLKRGQEFKGQISLECSGSPGLSIRLGAYGSGRRPLINASGKESAIQLLNAGYLEIADIETSGGDKAGILIGCSKDDLELNHIRVVNCFVHDTGDTTKLDWDYSTTTGGIIAVNGTFDREGKPVLFNSVLNNVVIDGCTVRYNRRWTCISISSGKKDGRRGDSNFIRNCIAEYSVADGIRMNGVKNSRIEYCVMYRNGAWPKKEGRNLGGLGAWFFDAENCTIQYCEASYVGANTTDGGAFDIDYWQKNSTVQYCYGHHCAGYGVSVFGADPTFPTVNSTVRYNIFSNNGRDSAFVYEGDFFIFTWSGGLLDGVNIHDNLSIWDPVAPGAAIKFDADFTGENLNTFTNNIICAKQPWLASFSSDSLASDNNTYWVSPSGVTTGAHQPLWQLKDAKYESLKAWQTATGLDRQSKYEQPLMKIPGWYKTGTGNNSPESRLVPGMKAPEFSAKTFNREKIKSAELKGHPVLLAFTNLSGYFESPDSDALRAQLVFLKSMERQYADKGLKIILVDDRRQEKVDGTSGKSYANLISDLAEDLIVISDDRQTGIAEKYDIKTFPSTFLIAADGTIVEKWENLALPAQLAFAIEKEPER